MQEKILNFLRNRLVSTANAQEDKVDNRVTVRVWHAKDSKGNQTSAKKVVLNQGINNTVKENLKDIGNVGHASVETSDIYASFWPICGVNSLKDSNLSENQFAALLKSCLETKDPVQCESTLKIIRGCNMGMERLTS